MAHDIETMERARLAVDQVARRELRPEDLTPEDMDAVNEHIETLWELSREELDELQASISVAQLTGTTDTTQARRQASRILETLVALMQIQSAGTIRNLRAVRASIIQHNDPSNN